jgi:cyclophilin family peptidyl-prolyl cis-trans isomerase
MKRITVFVVLLMALGVTGEARAATARKPGGKPVIGEQRVLFRTNRGDLVIGLYDKVAPKHAAQIRRLVSLGVYDSCTFFRVEPGYLVQITDAPNRKNKLNAEQMWALSPIPAEFSKLPHRPGVVSMAREDRDVNSAKSSFSVMLGRAPDLDGKYTVVGEVEWGMPLLKQIAREPRDGNNKPRAELVVEKAEVKSGAEIAELRSAGKLRNVLPLASPASPASPASSR